MFKPFEPYNGYCQNDCKPEPPPPCPDMPGFCPPPKPGPAPCVPPAPSVIRGMDLYEAMEGLTDRVNTCIRTYNDVMANAYQSLRNIQCAAEQNGSYYGCHEVWTEEGYSAAESAKYVITHKAACDVTGAPIEVELQLAYNSTTNSGVTQDAFSASEVTFADKLFAAIPVKIPVAPPEGQTWPAGWYGHVFYKGAPLPSIDVPTLYTVGFTRNGYLKAYSNAVSEQQFKQDCIVNAMGCSGILALNGQLTDESYRNNIPNAATQSARILVGQNYETKEVLFLATGNEDNPGMTSVTAANVLLGYGCTVIVELCEGVDACALDKGQMQIIPTGDDVPQLYAYWFISRRRHYKNRYQRELAELTQEYGHCIWQIYLSKLKVDGFDNRLKKEIADRIAADENLQNQITTNTGDIGQLKTDVAALENAVADLTNRVGEVETRMTALEAQMNLLKITVDQHTQDIATLQTKTDNLQNAMTALNASVLALQTSVTDLQTQFSDVLTQFRALQNSIATINNTIGDWGGSFPTTTITQEVNGLMSNFADYLPLTGGTLSGPLYGTTATMGGTEYGKNKITAGAAAAEFEIQLDANNSLTYSSDSLDVGDAKIQGVQTPVSDTDAANKKYVDDAISGGITPPTGDYLPLTGGQMKGSISMGTTFKVTDLAAPTADSDAATKSYVDSHTPTGDYLPLTGGTLTGPVTITTTGDDVPLNINGAQYSESGISQTAQPVTITGPNGSSMGVQAEGGHLQDKSGNGLTVNSNKAIIHGGVSNIIVDDSGVNVNGTTLVNNSISNPTSLNLISQGANKSNIFITPNNISISGNDTNQIDIHGKIVNIGSTALSSVGISITETDILLKNSSINVTNQKIINLAPPTSNTDAANKQYVDSKSFNVQTWGSQPENGVYVDGCKILLYTDSLYGYYLYTGVIHIPSTFPNKANLTCVSTGLGCLDPITFPQFIITTDTFSDLFVPESPRLRMALYIRGVRPQFMISIDAGWSASSGTQLLPGISFYNRENR